MKRIYAWRLVMLAGSLLVFSSGCITGTNTFSSVGTPATQYCSSDEKVAPVFDLPAAPKRGTIFGAQQTTVKVGQTVSLIPES